MSDSLKSCPSCHGLNVEATVGRFFSVAGCRDCGIGITGPGENSGGGELIVIIDRWNALKRTYPPKHGEPGHECAKPGVISAEERAAWEPEDRWPKADESVMVSVPHGPTIPPRLSDPDFRNAITHRVKALEKRVGELGSGDLVFTNGRIDVLVQKLHFLSDKVEKLEKTCGGIFASVGSLLTRISELEREGEDV